MTTRRIHCIQHSERVRPLAVADWAEARADVELVVVRADLGELPRADEVAGLIVMGGEMNTDEADRHPWIDDERALLAELVERDDVTIFGICLGSQLLAEVLGGSVGRAEHREVGWQHLTLNSDAVLSRVFGALPETFHAFEWHGDSWQLPPGAQLMASGPTCATQAFEWEDRVFAVQFHPEFTHERTTELAASTTDDLTTGGSVQAPDAFLAHPERFTHSRTLLDTMLDGAFPQG